MKKFMLLTTLCSLMLVFTSNVSAQEFTILPFAINNGAGTPAAGHQISFTIHTRVNSEPNAPAGTKYMMIGFIANGKQYASGQMQLSPQDAKLYENQKLSKFAITKIENPLPIRMYDGLKMTMYHNDKSFMHFEVTQGNGTKSLGKMKIYLKKL